MQKPAARPICFCISNTSIDLLMRSGTDIMPEIHDFTTKGKNNTIYMHSFIRSFTLGCTYFAVRKYLKLNTDELHY